MLEKQKNDNNTHVDFEETEEISILLYGDNNVVSCPILDDNDDMETKSNTEWNKI